MMYLLVGGFWVHVWVLSFAAGSYWMEAADAITRR